MGRTSAEDTFTTGLAEAGRAARKASRLAILLCSSVAAALVLAASASADWNQYRGDAARSGSATWSAASPPAGVVDWQKELGPGPMVDASPVVNPNTGVIYLGTTGESSLKPGARLFAFYPNGTLRWAVPLDGYDVRAAPAVRRDGFPVVVGEHVVSDGYSWKLSERIFLVDQFTGATRAVRSEPGGWYGMSPVVDESRNETYVRTSDGLWRLDRRFGLQDDLKASGGTVTGGTDLWGDIWNFLGSIFPPGVDFDPSGTVGQGSEPPRPPRLPSPAFSAACDDVVWSLPQAARARGNARGSRAFGYFQPPTPVATPALGKAGRMYAPVLDKNGRVYLEAYDQFAKTPAWRAGPLGDRPASPAALGRAPGGATTANCTRVRDGKSTVVRDQRLESVYLAVGPTLYAFDDGGQLRWKHSPGAQFRGERWLGEPVVVRLQDGGELILVSVSATNGTTNRLVAYRSDGQLVWSRPLDGPALGSPAVANGHIYVATTHSLYAIH